MGRRTSRRAAAAVRRRMALGSAALDDAEVTTNPLRFAHETLPQRVCFAAGEAADAVAEEVRRLGGSRVMAIATNPDRAEPVLAGVPVAVLHTDVVRHVPVEVAERARAVAQEHDVDVLVSVGGGSTTGLAKAVALTTGLPIVAVPTTYSGSEATDVWGLTEGGRKATGVDRRVLPRSVVYDASLMLALPVATSVASGLNALAHCVDAMWGPRTDPIDQALALEGIRAAGCRPGPSRHRTDGPRRSRADAVRRLPLGRRVRLGRIGPAPQDLPRAGWEVRPPACRDACRRPALRARAQRPGRTRPRRPDGRRLRGGLRAGRAAATAPCRGRAAVPARPRAHRGDLATAVGPILEAAPPSNPVPVTAEAIEELLRAAYDGSDPR